MTGRHTTNSINTIINSFHLNFLEELKKSLDEYELGC